MGWVIPTITRFFGSGLRMTEGMSVALIGFSLAIARRPCKSGRPYGVIRLAAWSVKYSIFPAEAGIQKYCSLWMFLLRVTWIPVFTGTTVSG